MTISPFLNQKLSRRFRTYDHDGSGFIEKKDFEIAVANICNEFGHGVESPARHRLYELTMQLWEHLSSISDGNSDGRISEAEYKSAFARGMLVTPETFDLGYIPFLEAIMDIVDEDEDNHQSRDEYARWTNSLMNLPIEDAHAGFAVMDTDGDGLITNQQMLEAIRAYYFDEDPQSIGSLLLGKIVA
jgi:Ca2+-binding EF-hand superfamily protein